MYYLLFQLLKQRINLKKSGCDFMDNEKKNLELKIEIDSNELKKVLAPRLNLNNYRVIFKEEFIKNFLYMNKPCNLNIKFLNERWEKISKGYNFIIGIGEHYYSVEYFNKIIGNKDAKESM